MTQQKVSYSPFIQRFSAPPIRGRANNATRIRPQVQKAPLNRKGLKTRDNNRPAENENRKRNDPAVNSVDVSEKPAQISPNGPHTAKIANPHAAIATTPPSSPVESLRRTSAYRILPTYSK